MDDSREDRNSEVTTPDKLSSGSLSSMEDIQEAIVGLKRTILETEVSSDLRRDVVHKLIRLRIKEQDLENRKFYQSPGEVETLRHTLVPVLQKFPARSYCDECGSAVWPLLQTIYECKICSHIVHAQCLNRLSRKCVGAWLHPLEDVGAWLNEDEGTSLIFDGSIIHNICPEISLAEQGYSCAECGVKLHPNSGHRLCDYLGSWFCTSCHWGYPTQIPARIIHNWDFTPMPVSQAALQYLGMMKRRPVIDLKQLSPGLTIITAELSSVVRQRSSILMMKSYLTVCRVAAQFKLLRKLEERQHFVDTEHHYSLQDLIDVESGVLGTWLGQVLESWQDHIFSCILCRAKGFVCELCSEKGDILFPFTLGTETCPDCSAVFHRECYRQVSYCPRCERKRERALEANEVEN